MTTHDRVIVVGGGVAGLAAAVRLSSRGVPVLLLEQRPYAGGRTRSFRDEQSGDTIDNGQHLLIAGYRRTFAFLDTLGVRDRVEVRPQTSLLFHHPARGFRRFSLPPLPAPLNLASGVLLSDLLKPRDRLGLLRTGSALARPGGENHNGTVAGWLDAHGASAEARRSFWHPLTLAVMNETPERGAARPFLHAMKSAFLGSPGGSTIALPRVGLSELFVDPALAYLRERGNDVCCDADVVGLLREQERVRGVRLRNGEEIAGRAVILAVPWYTAAALTGEGLNDAEASPIVSVHLWYAEDVMPDQSVGLIERRLHWVFNRRRIDRAERAGGHLSAVISAARNVVEMSNEEIISLAAEEISGVYPRCGDPLRGVVIREKRATVSLTPAVDRIRPSCRTSLQGLFLAGDWTATNLPATIEGAVESGERCADLAWASIASFESNGDI